ncbi:MAG: hypothetical protein LBV31_02305 [Prevotellaceae bacterium]|jgi:hypothetical protein|nr:hypothetical protein [Prevotellaceae bacterium]
MKSIKFLAMLVLATSVAVISCKKDEPTPPVIENILTVTQPDGSVFTKKDLVVELISTSKTDSVLIKMNEVQFSEAMPVSITMKLPVVAVQTESTTTFSGDAVTPLLVTAAGDRPYPSFIANGINGALAKEVLNLSLDIVAVSGMGPTVPAGTIYKIKYYGTAIKVAE